MKKVSLSVLLWPVVLVAGWFATRLSERYADAFDALDFDFEEEWS